MYCANVNKYQQRIKTHGVRAKMFSLFVRICKIFALCNQKLGLFSEDRMSN